MLLEDRAQQVVRRDAGIYMFQGKKTRELLVNVWNEHFACGDV